MAAEALKARGCFPLAVKRMFLTQMLPSGWDPPQNWKLRAFWVGSAKNIHHGCNSVIRKSVGVQQTQHSRVSPQGWAGTPVYLVLKWNFTAWKRPRIPPACLTVLILQKYPPRLSAAARDEATAQPWRFCGAWELSLRPAKNPFTGSSKSTWKRGGVLLLLRWFKSILALI